GLPLAERADHGGDMARRSIAGLRAIVTGASSGIGRALVIELVRGGANVVGLARRGERVAKLAAEVAAPERFAWIAGDVTSREDRAAALALCRERFGGLDALVNNAGIGALGSFAAADEARLRQVFEVNFFAPAEFTREALPALRQGKAPIVVNVGSVLGHFAVPGKSEYCASKFALHGLSDALRIELAREGIDLLLVSPSTTSSEFFDVAIGEREAAAFRFGSTPPEAVALGIVRAIQAGRREIILSASGNLLVWLDRLCPLLAQWVLSRWG
ncbi:MAG: SDR family NAD(P)-dependent oxidoreductase, partial [Planctomycetaceae bacterium]|nr:SDR family NAD(P)-dependent oxidoreductase [Planctomycetaceae bacterium]